MVVVVVVVVVVVLGRGGFAMADAAAVSMEGGGREGACHICRRGLAACKKKSCRALVFVGPDWVFGRLGFSGENATKNTWRSRRATAPADLEPPKGSGLGFNVV